MTQVCLSTKGSERQLRGRRMPQFPAALHASHGSCETPPSLLPRACPQTALGSGQGPGGLSLADSPGLLPEFHFQE